MAKIQVDYGDVLKAVHEAMADNRVLLACRKPDGGGNAMAIGWGTSGIIWSRPIFIALVRPSRYTYQLIEASGDFTVNVAPTHLKEAVNYCGTVSGRHQDKLAHCGLTAVSGVVVSSPIIAECIIHLECRVIYRSDLIPNEIARSVAGIFYAAGDYHRCYFGEVVCCQVDEKSVNE